MKCLLCRLGETTPGITTVTLHRENTIVVIKNIPADICNNCGEYYLSETMTAALLDRAETALQNGAELEVLKFAA